MLTFIDKVCPHLSLIAKTLSWWSLLVPATSFAYISTGHYKSETGQLGSLSALKEKKGTKNKNGYIRLILDTKYLVLLMDIHVFWNNQQKVIATDKSGVPT